MDTYNRTILVEGDKEFDRTWTVSLDVKPSGRKSRLEDRFFVYTENLGSVFCFFESFYGVSIESIKKVTYNFNLLETSLNLLLSEKLSSTEKLLIIRDSFQ